ncbi:MAG: efflux RND transporter periplasmic adaptor subunit [Verrucomicrobiota bacterium JB025]|nr:efflux RND transporter periplasmic adaptor subunit [Verrucomicrobiota bacterium JB025]
MSLHFPLIRTLALTLAAGTLLTSCGENEQAAAAPQMPAMPVHFTELKPQDVTITRELPGRTSAFRVSEVRARVDGIVIKRNFTEGSTVKEGDLLYQIDPAPFEARLASVKASLAQAEARYLSAEAQAARYEKLAESKSVSEQSRIDALSAKLTSKAEIEAAKAAVRSAEIDLGYTSVTAPISGLIGKSEITEGAFVRAAEATLLATVRQIDPLYVDLSQSADDVLRIKKELESGRLVQTQDGSLKLEIVTNDDVVQPHPGSLAFSDITVDESTGTVTLRGTVPNPDMHLYPGMFVRARISEGTRTGAVLIPQSLVSRSSSGSATTYVISSDNTVEMRFFETERAVGDSWLVKHGLKAGDKVIIDNIQKIRPGSPVIPFPEDQPFPAPAAH